MTPLGVALFVGFLVFVVVLRIGVEVCRGYDEATGDTFKEGDVFTFESVYEVGVIDEGFRQ